MTARALTASLLVLVPAVLAGAQMGKDGPPESFTANAQATGATGGIAGTIVIQIDDYTRDADHAAMAAALKDSYEAFVAALRKAPVVGAVKIGDRSVPIRWARQQRQTEGRRVAVVTETPVFFAGAGSPNAKPTEGFDVGVFEFTVDSVGLGSGTMAPAAHVKAGGPTGVEIDDYAGKRITLVTVTKKIS